MYMEYGQAFPNTAREPGYRRKLLIAGALSLIPVVGWILLLGYAQTAARRVTQNQHPALPEWAGWGALFRRGLGWIFIVVVYLTPLLILVGLLAGLVASIDWAAPQLAGTLGLETVNGAALVLALCANLITIAYGVFALLMLVAAGGRYAASDRMVDAFRLGEIWRALARRPGVYIVIVLVNSLVFLAAGAVGVVACGIGLAWGSAFATLVAGHLSGQAHRSAGTVLEY
jgi:hypothetical protein